VRVRPHISALRRTLPLCLLASLCALLAACGRSEVAASSNTRTSTVSATSSTTAPSSASPAESLQEQYLRVIARVEPSVVQISNPQGLGSGIALNDTGDIVTNAHVIAGGGPYKVTDAKGKVYSAKLVGSFTPDDLAVVHAEGASLPPAKFAKSASLRVGDIVLAIGNPLGLRSSVTDGIISALGRTVDEPNGVVLPNVIQTSAPINPGNSGGALVDLQGEVVGIPTLAATDPQLGGAAVGIGFAIPSSLALEIASQIVRYRHVVESHRAFIGIEIASGISNEAVIAAVLPGTPAEKASLQRGDVIVAIGSMKISGPQEVAEALATMKPGQEVTVQVITPKGAHRSLKVTLGQYPGTGS
jgi:putative serine protease PepD